MARVLLTFISVGLITTMLFFLHEHGWNTAFSGGLFVLGFLSFYLAYINSEIIYGVSNPRQEIGLALLGRNGTRVIYFILGICMMVTPVYIELY